MYILFMYSMPLETWIYVDTFELEKDAYTIAFSMAQKGIKTEVTTNSHALEAI